MVNSENSSDLDLGLRPELKSDEFSEFTIWVVEIQSIGGLKPLKRVMHMSGERLGGGGCGLEELLLKRGYSLPVYDNT